ncbi:hypothetical protein HF313_22935 [Massilia atriviolacea]|uniref:Uncharacterized protein n=1 Tax=Massilia atriviolacea TaxID=2495579 RepID=A0A430HCL0_9BURK|nr:hypothetical protein [Massilia atriviolacea]RSZ55253.1 hypothetical protein EJB06_30480 [Massilia atriviolacea]
MQKLISRLFALYLISLILIVPASIVHLWDFSFNSLSADKRETLFSFAIWTFGGFIVLVKLMKYRHDALRKTIQLIKPDNYQATIEISGPHACEYFGIDHKNDHLLLVDIKQKIARCERIDFLRAWKIEGDGFKTYVLFSFNSFELSTLKIFISPAHRHDLAAKLNLALQY